MNLSDPFLRVAFAGPRSTFLELGWRWFRHCGLGALAGLGASTIGLAAGPEIAVEPPPGGTVVSWGSPSSTPTVPAAGQAGVRAIAAGGTFTLALKTDGSVTVWGSNAEGETTVPRELAGVQAVSAGYFHAVALKDNGTVVAWGSNHFGEGGIGGVTGVQAIAAGHHHTVALMSDGTVVARGYDGFGQTHVPAGLAGVRAVAAGGDHTVVLKNDGTVVAWGRNDEGQATVPAGLTGVQAIAAGEDHSLALKTDGTVVGWGSNYHGGTSVPAGLKDVRAIAAGDYQSLALKSDGTLVAWGSNFLQTAEVPGGLTGVQAVAASPTHNLALVPAAAFLAQRVGTASAAKIHTIKNTGDAVLHISSVRVVGENAADFSVETAGMLTAVPATTGQTTFTVTFTPSARGPRAATLRVLSDDADTASFDLPLTGVGIAPVISIEEPPGTPLGHHVIAWGRNFEGQTSIPAGLTGVRALAAGIYHTLALKTDGTVVAWGVGGGTHDYGQAIVPAGLRDVQAVAAGGFHSVALKSDGTVVAWGQNLYGQRDVPSDLMGVRAIAAGYPFTAAVKSDGTVVAWGSGSSGETAVPVGLTDVQAIAAPLGGNHTVALKGDGTVAAWGYNPNGQTFVPAGLTGVRAVAAGGGSSFALLSGGTIVPWGQDYSGQTDALRGLTAVQAIAVGENHVLALKSDGTVAAWGGGGDGETTVPVGLTDVQGIAAGWGFSAALVPAGAFGGQVVATTSASRTFAIKNTGNTAHRFTRIGALGGNTDDFLITNPLVLFRLPPLTGQTTLTVTFTPRATGRRATTLRLQSDDPEFASVDIPLSGTGLLPPATDDAGFTSGRRPVDLDVLANDPAANRNAAAISFVKLPQYGTVRVVGGKVRYTPRGLPSGDDYFTYRYDDGRGGSDVATVRIEDIAITQGEYDGLLTDASAADGAEAHEHSGHLRLSVTAGGAFSGTIIWAGVKVRTSVSTRFRGVGRDNRLSALGRETRLIQRPPLAPIALEWQYDAQTRTIAVTAASVDAAGRAFVATGVLAGRYRDGSLPRDYTMRIEPPAATGVPVTIPQGLGFAALRIGAGGRVKIAGRLADGAVFSSGTWRHLDGSFLVYGRLYPGPLNETGSVRGTVAFLQDPVPVRGDAAGELRWFKPARTEDGRFPGGFTLSCPALCWRYWRPAPGQTPFGESVEGVFRVAQGGLGGSFEQRFTLGANHHPVVTEPASLGLRLSTNSATGVFNGTFVHPVSHRRTPFRGAVSQRLDLGFGYFLGTGENDGGAVTIQMFR